MATISPTAEVPEAQPSSRPMTGPLDVARQRIDSIDLLRGLVMIFMLLDHTRDFIHSPAIYFQDPTDLSTTTPFLFFTRWISHFCAPVFVFLAGTGAYLQLARGKSKKELSKFLLTRGLWLIVLEFTLVRIGLVFNLDYSFVGLAQVIWVIGVSMIVLSLLVFLPVGVIGAFGIAMIFLHNLLDRFQMPADAIRSPGAILFAILHQTAPIPVLGRFPGPIVFEAYPLIPWIGVLAAGYAFGVIYQMNSDRRRRILMGMGVAAIALFIVVRWSNLYGDPAKWTAQKNAVFTFLSFINLEKYPPSLLYLLATLGPAFIFLALVEGRERGIVSRALITFGRVPLFFYLLQWYVAHGIAVLLGLVAGQPVGWQFVNFTERFNNMPKGVGFGLEVVYLSWIAGLLLLYPLCKWFSGVKRRRSDWWLSYL